MLETLDKTLCLNNITNKQVNSYITNTIKNYKSVEQPICVITVGGPASGKSTISKIYIREILLQNINNFCIINPDIILEKYFDNNINCYEIDKNSPYVYINKLFHKAIIHKYNILYDTTGLNIKDIKKKIKLLEKHNYKINICISIIDDLSIVYKRLKKRFNNGGRNIDKDYLLKKYQELPAILDNFYFTPNNLEKFNQIIIFNTTKNISKIELILEL